MIGPTGCGKTEISRRLARLAQAPFVKVEATKFTEVGYVGRDVEQIVRDLVEIAIGMTRERLRKEVEPKAELAAAERVLDALVGSSASADTRQKFRKRLREGELDDREIEIAVQESAAASLPTFEIPGMPGAQMGMLNLGDIFGKAFGTRSKPRRMTVADSHRVLVAEESDKLLDQETVVREATTAVEQNGIVFIDEIDKVGGRRERRDRPLGPGEQHGGREHRGAALAHDPRAAARGDQLHRLRSARGHPGRDRPRLCAREGRRARTERRSVPLHPVKAPGSESN